jgi:hypothetical protein
MRSRRLIGAFGLAVATWISADGLRAAPPHPPNRKPLGPREREAVLALVKAVDLAQASDTASDPALAFDYHILKSGNDTGYIPFTLTPAAWDAKSTALYVRAVSRHDGMRSSSEHSFVRDWLLHQRDVMPRQAETVYVGIGEMPLAGLAGASSRQATAAAAAASASLAQQQKDMEKQKRADEEAKHKAETRELDPLLFPFEEYFFVESASARGTEPRTIERALALPPGEYDVYVGIVDRARIKTSSAAVVHRTVTVPDFWSDQLTLSSLILAKDVRSLKTTFAAAQQAEHPYAFGAAEVIPSPGALFTTDEALTVVFQMCKLRRARFGSGRQLHVLSRRRRAAVVQPDRPAVVRRCRSAAGRRVGIAGIRVADGAAAAVPAGAVRARSAGERSPDAGVGDGDRGVHGRVWVKISVRPVGAWLSLVEHSVRDRGVGGSNPLAPTNSLNKSLGFCRGIAVAMVPCRSELSTI